MLVCFLYDKEKRRIKFISPLFLYHLFLTESNCDTDNSFIGTFDKVDQIFDCRTFRNQFLDSEKSILEACAALVYLTICFRNIIYYIILKSSGFRHQYRIDSILSNRIMSGDNKGRNIFVGTATVP